MQASDVIEGLPITDWQGPFAPACADAGARCAGGRPRAAGATAVPSGAGRERSCCRPPSWGASARTSASIAATGRVSNTSLSGAEAERLRAMLRRFADAAETIAARSAAWLCAGAAAGAHQFPPGGDRWPRSIRRGTTTGCCMSMRFPAGRCAGGASCACSATSRRTAHRVPGGSASRSLTSPASSCRAPARRCRAAPGSCSGWASPRGGAANTTGSCCACTTRESWTPPTSPARREADCGVCRRHDVAVLHRSGAARGARRALRAGADIPFAGRGDGASGAFAAAGAGAAGRPRADIAQPIGGQSGIVPPRDQRDGASRKHRSQCSHGKRCRKRPCDQQAGER